MELRRFGTNVHLDLRITFCCIILVVKGHYVFDMYYHDPRITTCCVHRCVILLLSSTVLYVLLHVQNPQLKHLGTLCIG